MAGLFGFSDQDLLNLVMQQHQLMQLMGAKPAQGYGWSPLYGPQDSNAPPLPERNPNRKYYEDEVKRMMQDQTYIDSLYLEGQSRLGHSPPMYPESEYPPQWMPKQKRREMKAT